MASADIPRILRDLAETKCRFLLSDVAAHLGSGSPKKLGIGNVRAHLSENNLAAAPLPHDWAIYPGNSPLVLTTEERDRLARHFQRHFPPQLENLIRDYIARKTGKSWDDPITLDRLRRAIQAQKGAFWQKPGGRDITYQKGYATLAYLAYHFPVYFMQTQKVLLDLVTDGLLPEYFQVLDAGSGPGVVTLAIADFFRVLGRGEVWVYSIERSEEAREAFRFLTAQYVDRTRVHALRTIDADLRNLADVKLPPDLDLVVFSNVLNEVAATDVQVRAHIVLTVAGNLGSNGSIAIVEPADKHNSTELRRTTALLARQGLHVYSPCTFLWGGSCQAKECWTFEELPSIAPTPLMLALAGPEEGFRYINTDIKFSTSVIRKDDRARICHRVPRRAKVARLSQLGKHVHRRIHIVAAVMSGDLGDARTRVHKLCDGSARDPVYLMAPRHLNTESAYLLAKIPYGTIIS
ncbi:MAG: small ribosomal subunit Rsm22 family protein, partial [Methanomicrobiales archaeon]|nr:small ribosomal subunit Rsm22 family protein [Methanomicrobiales archaeon]